MAPEALRGLLELVDDPALAVGDFWRDVQGNVVLIPGPSHLDLAAAVDQMMDAGVLGVLGRVQSDRDRLADPRSRDLQFEARGSLPVLAPSALLGRIRRDEVGIGGRLRDDRPGDFGVGFTERPPIRSKDVPDPGVDDRFAAPDAVTVLGHEHGDGGPQGDREPSGRDEQLVAGIRGLGRSALFREVRRHREDAFRVEDLSRPETDRSRVDLGPRQARQARQHGHHG